MKIPRSTTLRLIAALPLAVTTTLCTAQTLPARTVPLANSQAVPSSTRSAEMTSTLQNIEGDIAIGSAMTDLGSAEKARKHIISARTRLLPLISDLKQDDLEVWRLAGKLGRLEPDRMMAAQALEAIQRLAPNHSDIKSLAEVMAELTAAGLDSEVELVRTVRTTHAKALEGDAQSQLKLGAYYTDGRGVARDDQAAFRWLSKAADQGNATAQAKVGICYATGAGVTANGQEAIRWLTRSAQQGDPLGQSNLGACYLAGKGTEVNASEAIRWFTKAAEQGHADAQFNLGICHMNGQGVPKDMAKAVEWFAKAAENGHAAAQYNMGFLCSKGEGVAKDNTKAFRWYSKAAQQGYAEAQFSLAVQYMTGEGTARNESESLRWFTAAAEQGHAKSQYNLGAYLSSDKNPSKDDAKARSWFKLLLSNPAAPADLKRMAQDRLDKLKK